MQVPVRDIELDAYGRARQDARAASTDAHSCSPQLVTRGETYHPANMAISRGVAIVDWLAFTVKLPSLQNLSWLLNALDTCFCVPRTGWVDRGRGWFGYSHRINLGEYGLLAYGGESQKDTYHVELNAHACARIADWNAVRLWGEVYGGGLTRLDLAHDDFSGTAINIDVVLDWWKVGSFLVGGRPPRAEFIDDMGSGRGKTVNIGRRASGKMARFYEKGRQLGDPGSPWVRAEVELHNKGRLIPWEAVTLPAQYLTGAYPVLSFLGAEQSRIRTIQRTGQISYETMEKNLRMQGGKAINAMCQVHRGDAGAVVARLVRDGLPKRLAGLGDVLDDIECPVGSGP